MLMHFIVLFFVKKNTSLDWSAAKLDHDRFFKKLKIDKIELIKPEDIPLLRNVGVKGGKKGDKNPDMPNHQRFQMPGPNLSFENLGYNATPSKAANPASNSKPNPLMAPNKIPDLAPTPTNNDQSGIYFNYKKQKVIPQSKEHNNIKTEVVKNLGIDKINSRASNISNFDIRIERPEGVSEDQLNSDEKAFYSFYKRTYMNYVSKLFSTYEEVRVNKPGIDRDFEDKHLLIAKIDYDENGNIITIKILKSSDSDNVHYFFEEALKKLNIPNPPKIFIKKQKQFTIYYQIHIN